MTLSRTVLFGSANRARLERFRTLLKPLEVDVLCPPDLGIQVAVIEDGRTPEENATKKANAYFSRIRVATFATDYALYIDKLPPAKQPGVFVGRISGRAQNASDAELLDYYADELGKVGGVSGASWVAAAALVVAPGMVFTRCFTERTVFTSRRSPVLTPDEPLNSLQFVSALGKYKSEMTPEERARAQLAIDQGIVAFIAGQLASPEGIDA